MPVVYPYFDFSGKTILHPEFSERSLHEFCNSLASHYRLLYGVILTSYQSCALFVQKVY